MTARASFSICLGAVLTQKQPDSDAFRPVAYISRTLTATEQHYAPHNDASAETTVGREGSYCAKISLDTRAASVARNAYS